MMDVWGGDPAEESFWKSDACRFWCGLLLGLGLGLIVASCSVMILRSVWDPL